MSDLLNELFDLNLICAECPLNHEIDGCSDCLTMKRLSYIRKELDKADF